MREGNKETCIFPPKLIMCDPKTQNTFSDIFDWMQECAVFIAAVLQCDKCTAKCTNHRVWQGAGASCKS